MPGSHEPNRFRKIQIKGSIILSCRSGEATMGVCLLFNKIVIIQSRLWRGNQMSDDGSRRERGDALSQCLFFEKMAKTLERLNKDMRISASR